MTDYDVPGKQATVTAPRYREGMEIFPACVCAGKGARFIPISRTLSMQGPCRVTGDRDILMFSGDVGELSDCMMAMGGNNEKIHSR
jgi:hypothetical protein